MWSTRLYGGPSRLAASRPSTWRSASAAAARSASEAREKSASWRRGTTHTSNGDREAYGREGDGVVVGVQEVVGPPDLLAHEPAVRALALADQEARRAAQLLGDPVRDLRQVVEVEAQVVRPGARLRAPVLDDLEVLRPGGPPRRADLVAAALRAGPR